MQGEIVTVEFGDNPRLYLLYVYHQTNSCVIAVCGFYSVFHPGLVSDPGGIIAKKAPG